MRDARRRGLRSAGDRVTLAAPARVALGLVLLLATCVSARGAWAQTTSTRTPALRLGPVPAELEADVLRGEPTLGVYQAEGNVVLRRGRLVVYADRAFLDRKSGAVVAEGNVVAVDGTSVLACRRVVLAVPELGGAIDDAELRLKRRPVQADTGRAALLDGEDVMRLTARRLERTGSRRFEAYDADFTPCHCLDGTPPDWKLAASSADVDVDSGAWLYSPVLYVRDIPILILPVLYVPLGERRTGVLLPRGGYDSNRGFSVTLPLYVTLGESWDATLELSGWLSRGPAPGLELRWAPAPGHSGELYATLLLDAGENADGWSPTRDSLLPRWALSGRHRGTSGTLTVAADVNVAGDLDFVREFGAQLLDRQVEESVSRVTLASPLGDHLRVAGGLALHQSLRVGDYPAAADRRLVRLFDPEHTLSYRFAELHLDALPYALVGSSWSPLARARLVLDATGRLDEPSAVVARADLRPALSWPLALPGLSVVPELALRLSARTPLDGSTEGEGRIAAVARTTAELELSARLGPLTHVLRPRLTHLWLGLLAGEPRAPGPLDDELTLLGDAHQLLAGLHNELYLTGQSMRVAALDVLVPRTLGDVVGRAPLVLVAGDLNVALPFGVLTAAARVEVDEAPVAVSEWRVTSGLTWTSVGSASLTYASLGDTPPLASLVAGEELVYGARVPLGDPWSAFRGIVGAVSLSPLPWLRLDSSVFVDIDAAAPLRNLRGAIGLTSGCECWSARLVVDKSRDRDFPSFSFMLDLAQVGGTGF